MSFRAGFSKLAEGPALDPQKVKEFTQGFNSGGPSFSQAFSNIKKGLGFGAPKAPTPPPAPGNVGKMNGF